MKHLLLALLCILPFYGNAIIRAKRDAPVLHSIFDAKTAQQLPAVNAVSICALDESAGPRRRLDPARAARRQEAGIIMMVVGTLALAGAYALIKKGAELNEENRTVPGSSANGVFHEGLGVLAGSIGLGLFIPGIIMTIRYSNRSWY